MVRMGNIVIDLDHDFFLQSEDGVIDAPFNDLHGRPFPNDFFDLFEGTSFKTIINHEEALDEAIDANITDSLWLHFDHHHDWYIDHPLLETISPSTLEGVLTEGNYAAIASKIGIIKTFIWIYPDTLVHPSILDIPESFRNVGIRVSTMSWSEYLKSLHKKVTLENVRIAIYCLSPAFVPETNLRSVLRSCQDTEFVYRALDTGYDKNISGIENKRVRLYEKKLAAQSQILFHGSMNSGIKQLNNRENYISSSIGFAACYCLKINSDLGWIQGIDKIGHSHEMIFISPPTGEKILYDEVGFLYQIKPKKNTVFEYGDCGSYDMRSGDVLDVLIEKRLSCVRSFLQENFVVLPEPGDEIELDIESEKVEFIRWMGMPLRLLKCLKSSPFWINIYRAIKSKQTTIVSQPLIYWERLAIRCLYPLIEGLCRKTCQDSYHGFGHGRDVALTTVVLSYFEGVNPLPAFLAALCHDLESNLKSTRLNRAERSAQIVESIFSTVWSDFDGGATNDIIHAVRTHSKTGSHLSKTSAILRDADRLRLAWERGYNPKYFHTTLGHELAKAGPVFHGHLIKRIKFDKLNVLELSRINNSFCLSIWSSGRRFYLKTRDTLERSFILKVSAEYNITFIVIDHVVNYSEISTSLPSPGVLKSIFVNNIPNGAQLSDSILKSVMKTQALVVLTELTNIPELSQLQELSGSYQIHMAIGRYNYAAIEPILEDLMALDIQLVFVADNPDLAGPEMAGIAEDLASAKFGNPNLSSLRLITNLSWCWIHNPWVATAILAHADNSYSPLTSSNFIRRSEDFYKETLDDVRKKSKKCSDCAFVFNCISADYADSPVGFPVRPIYHHEYSTWAPYTADS